MHTPLRLFVYTSSPLILQFLVWPLTWLLLRVCMRIEIRGLEHVRNLPRGVIFASNHISQLDPIIIRASLPWFSKHSPMLYVARTYDYYKWEGWRRYIFTDLFFRLWGAWPAYKNTHDYAASLKHHLFFARNRYTVTIFPGGKQQMPDEPMQSRGGVAYLMFATNCPVVPVAIAGSNKVSFKTLLARTCNVSITFGPPFFREKLFISPEPSVDEIKAVAQTIVRGIEILRETR